MSSERMIEIRGLGKRYRLSRQRTRDITLTQTLAEALRRKLRGDRGDEFWALRDVDLDLHRGDILGLVGRNGAGKSTLLKILTRITDPSAGEARLWGRVGSLLEVGTGFHRELTGRENVYLNGSLLGMRKKEIDRRFDEIVAFSGVEKFLDTPVKRYSSGMYVRLAFAVAAHLDSEILIVDEVLAVGDVEFQRKCLGKMGEVAREHRTVLLVSHNMASMTSLCTRAVVLDGGRIVHEGTPDECAALYARLGGGEHGAAEAELARPDDADAWMQRVRLESAGAPTAAIGLGEPLTVAVSFAAEKPLRPNLGLVLRNEQGIAVLHVSSRYAPDAALDRAVRTGTIRVDLGVVPFTPGRYSLSLFFGGAIGDSHVAENVITVDVEPRDLWGGGRVYEPRHAALWWPARLSLETHDAAAAAAPR